MSKSNPPSPKQFDLAKQAELDGLLTKNSDGKISELEANRLKQLVDEAEQLMVDNGKLLAEFSKSEAPNCPSNAVPVTVWVAPGHVEP